MSRPLVRYFSKYSDRGPSSRYRIYQLLPFFRSAGIDVEVEPFFDDRYFDTLKTPRKFNAGKWLYAAARFKTRLLKMRNLSADLVVVEHQLFPYLPFALEARYLPRRYVIEFDDAIYLTHPNKMPKLLRRASAVFVGNQNLSSYASAFNSKVHIIPTLLDTERFYRRRNAESDVITIGWSGLAYNFKYLHSIAPVLRDVSKTYAVQIVIVSNAPPRDLRFPHRFELWDGSTEVEQISAFDIGLMPLSDDPWSRAKCGMKLLQYMALEVAAIASPVGVNTDMVIHGQNGFLAKSPGEWRQTLEEMILNESTRRKLAKAGRETVEQRYSVQRWFPRIEELYRMYFS